MAPEQRVQLPPIKVLLESINVERENTLNTAKLSDYHINSNVGLNAVGPTTPVERSPNTSSVAPGPVQTVLGDRDRDFDDGAVSPSRVLSYTTIPTVSTTTASSTVPLAEDDPAAPIGSTNVAVASGYAVDSADNSGLSSKNGSSTHLYPFTASYLLSRRNSTFDYLPTSSLTPPLHSNSESPNGSVLGSASTVPPVSTTASTIPVQTGSPPTTHFGVSFKPSYSTNYSHTLPSIPPTQGSVFQPRQQQQQQQQPIPQEYQEQLFLTPYQRQSFANYTMDQPQRLQPRQQLPPFFPPPPTTSTTVRQRYGAGSIREQRRHSAPLALFPLPTGRVRKNSINNNSSNAAILEVLPSPSNVTGTGKTVQQTAGAGDNNNNNTTTTTTTRTNASGRTVKRTNLAKEVVRVLNTWLLNHLDNPYPTAEEKQELLERTGLTKVQLSNWFINVRRRKVYNDAYGYRRVRPRRYSRSSRSGASSSRNSVSGGSGVGVGGGIGRRSSVAGVGVGIAGVMSSGLAPLEPLRPTAPPSATEPTVLSQES